MNLLEPGSWTRPHGPRPSNARAAPVDRASRGEAAHFLFRGDEDPRRDSRRVTLGLVALAVFGVVLLNFGIYQSAEVQLVERRWAQLERAADAKRDELRLALATLERQARYVAGTPELARLARVTDASAVDPSVRADVAHQLDRAARSLGLHHLAVVAPDGRTIASGGRDAVAPDHGVGTGAVLAGSVRRDIRLEADGQQTVEMAIPVDALSEDGQTPLLVACMVADQELIPMLRRWPFFGGAAHAYLVRREGGHVVYLTAPNPRAARPPAPVPLSASTAVSAAMAATGVESNIEHFDGIRSVRATTRHLPDLGWGLVSWMDRDILMADLRATLILLALVDVMIVVAAAFAALIWRRKFAQGLARRELQVTERHTARVQSIFDTAFDAIVTFDRTGRIRTTNGAAQRLFGRAAAELDGQPLHRVLRWESARAATPADEASAAAAPRALPRPGEVTRAEALRADGETLPTEISLGQAGAGDELLYTAIVRDIRERVESERRISEFAHGLESSNRRLEEMNAQLEEASRLKSEFLANTSHELRTPLNGMMGFLQLVLDGMCETREEERQFLEQSLQCSRHLLGLINDVLDIARIESGKLSLDIGRVDIESLFQDVRTVTHVQAAQKGVQLVFEPPADQALAARCDFAKTKQVLINLVGNSIKFTPKGSITVRATSRPRLGHVTFEVVDTGIGIPREQQRIVFEKFAQGDGSTTRKYGGTGLGLAISRSLVEIMGGVIGLESEGTGKGTRMYFSLPLWNEEAAEEPAADPPAGAIAGPAHGPLVVVVEDDAVFRVFLVALLHRSGYRTVEALHAESAWALIRRMRPACVVADYALSCAEGAMLRTGWDLAERMTKDPATRRIPVVIVTGYDRVVLDRLAAGGFERRPEHLVKPIEGPALISRIESMIGDNDGRPVRVLLADDDATVTTYVRAVLPQDRFNVDVAADGEECLHALRTQPNGYDLLLLDLMMPTVSGYDVLREMALAGLAAGLPVLVLTNFPEARNEEERRLLEHGIVLDIVSKTSVHDNPALLPHLIDWHLQHDAADGEREAA